MAPTPLLTPTDDLEETGDRFGSVRARASADVAALQAAGATVVELVTTEDLSTCNACRAVARRAVALDRAPLPPISGCEIGCECQIAPLSLE